MRRCGPRNWLPTVGSFVCGDRPSNPANGGPSARSPTDDAEALGVTLESMPLHIWRTDVVVPLGPHPNDPAGYRG